MMGGQMVEKTLYLAKEKLTKPLTVDSLRSYLPADAAVWISLDPQANLPKREGKRISGRLPGLAPLMRELPDAWGDIPLLYASIYGNGQWQHFCAAHPLSQQSGQLFTWRTTSPEGGVKAEKLNLQCRSERVLTWRDRARFGLETDANLPKALHVEHFYQAGKLITWRLLPMDSESQYV